MKVALALLVGAGLAGCGKKADGPIAKDDPDKVERIHVASRPDAATVSPHDTQLARGAYVVKAAGCLVCHTALGPTGPDFANAGAGGLEMPDPVAGTWRSPNITPDKASGIGSWTDDRVVAPNKKLQVSQPAVPPPANAPDLATDPVKHGEYLAALMLCGHCHMTPREPDHRFSGGLDMTISTLGTGKLYAPNITPDKDTGLGAWTEDNLYVTLKTMVRPTGKAILPPMSFLHTGWSQLEEADLRAVAAYIHQLPAIKHAVLPSTFVLK